MNENAPPLQSSVSYHKKNHSKNFKSIVSFISTIQNPHGFFHTLNFQFQFTNQIQCIKKTSKNNLPIGLYMFDSRIIINPKSVESNSMRFFSLSNRFSIFSLILLFVLMIHFFCTNRLLWVAIVRGQSCPNH